MKKEESFLYSLVKQFSKKNKEDKENSTTTHLDNNKELNSEDEVENNSLEENDVTNSNDETETKENSLDFDEFQFDKYEIDFNYVYDLAPEFEKEEKEIFESSLNKHLEIYNKNNKEITDPIDASGFVYITQNKCGAYMFVLPPRNDGQEVSLDILYEALNDAKIALGVEEEDLLEIVNKKQYEKIVKVATGQAPIHGVDGKIIHYIEVNKKPEYKEDVFGCVDFKNLNLENNISAETTICEIVYPTLQADGISVLGSPLLAKKGKTPKIPKGKNVYITADEKFLVAQVDGTLKYNEGVYSVETVYKIVGNVDNSVGNINFKGDVHIKGDVKSSFEIRAEGSVYIEGAVEEGVVIAGKDITVKEGVNGNNRGTLKAEGVIKSKYLENCIVYAGIDIYAGSIINCEVYANNKVKVIFEKGVVIGGSINALVSIEATTIGCESSRVTSVSLGKSLELIEEMKNLRLDLKTSKETLNKIIMNINFLEKDQNRTTQKEVVYQQLKGQVALYEEKIKELGDNLKELEIKSTDYSKCYLKANTIYSPCKVKIGDEKTLVRDKMNHVKFVLDENSEIRVFQ